MSLDGLIDRAGDRLEEHAELGARTTYRVGGRVRALLTLDTEAQLEQLAPLLFDCGLRVVTVGNGSNLLVADGEHELLVVRLRGEFATLRWRDEDGDVLVVGGAGLDLPVAARRLANEGIVGFEWAVGVPGTFGGAVAMNAGGHGSDMAASVVGVASYDVRGPRQWTNAELGFGYRTSAVSSSVIVTRVTLRLTRGEPEVAQARIKEIVRWRREHQPGGANAGSVFQNPSGDHAGRLIDVAGCRGMRVGNARVSEKHANFIVVDPDGTASDVFTLIRAVQTRVAEVTGIELRSEHRLLGFEESL